MVVSSVWKVRHDSSNLRSKGLHADTGERCPGLDAEDLCANNRRNSKSDSCSNEQQAARVHELYPVDRG